MVDLEDLAKVPDEDKEEQLLRIDSLRLMGSQAIICTADTVLAMVRNNRKGLYNSPAILTGAFVFDELHAYDNHMFAGVMALMEALPGASFLLMTASLPKQKKKLLLSKFNDIAEIPSPVELEEIPRYILK